MGNKSERDLCQFHAAKQYKKYASKRNDTNRTSLSNLRRNNSTKKSLSGSMNGVSISNYNEFNDYYNKRKKNNKYNPNINHKNMRQKNRNLLLSSSAMSRSIRSRIQRGGIGNKTILQIKEKQKKKEWPKCWSVNH